MNETFKWAAARILFVMALTFTGLTWVSVGAAMRETDYRLSVLAIVAVSVITWAGFLATYMTRKDVA